MLLHYILIHATFFSQVKEGKRRKKNSLEKQLFGLIHTISTPSTSHLPNLLPALTHSSLGPWRQLPFIL